MEAVYLGSVVVHGVAGANPTIAAVEKLKPLLKETPPLKDGESCCCRSSFDKVPATKHDEMTLMRVYPKDSHGLYRAGDELPPGTIGVV